MHTMDYFDDITFVDADIITNCAVVIDTCFPKTYSLEYVAAGKMGFALDCGASAIIGRPTAHWHHPGHSYQYGAVDDSGWHHHYVTFCGRRARRFLEQGLMPLSKAGYLPVARPLRFAEVFQQLVQTVKTRDPHEHGLAVVLLEQLLWLLSESARSERTASAHLPTIQTVAQRMRNDPYRDYCADDWAEKTHVSRSHFRRLFKSHVGHGFHDFLLQCKMQKAAEELRHLDRPIKNIARQAGYEDAAQFSKLFKSKVGLSPLQYRMTLPHYSAERGQA